MSDVFISYARSTAKQARQAAEALRGQGYSVWMDDELPAHRTYTHVIEEQMTAAKAALVIWSADAVRSEWVLSEANRAREDHKLVQLAVDGTRLPMPFDQIQCADLLGWTGDLNAAGWRKVVASIGALTGADAPATSGEPSPRAPPGPREPVLAVLAFENLSRDADMTYFSDGVSEEIQQTVARGAGLKVIGRSSCFQFRGADKAVRHVAEQLNVTHVLDGSVRRNGPKVRISAQLVECASEVILWSDRFDRDLSDIFALQDEIAAAVAGALKLAFAPAVQPRSIDPRAYDLYLKARELRFEELEVTDIIRSLEEVVAMAPTFAKAWAELAWIRSDYLRTGRCAQPYDLARAGVLEAAQTALGLDAGSGLAYLALTGLEPHAAYAAREAHLLKALACAPNDADVLTNIGKFYTVVGRTREGLGYIKQARDLDPLYPPAVRSYASMLHGVERLEAYDVACARWPDVQSILLAAIIYAAEEGDWARYDGWVASTAATHIDQMASVRDAITYGRRLRNPDPAVHERLLSRINAEIDASGTVRLNGLYALNAYGMADAAFDCASRASFDHMLDPRGPQPAGTYTPAIIFERPPGGLPNDIRFVGLCAKLGLCDYWLASGRWPDCAEEGSVDYDFKAEARRLAAKA
ncbi:MAG: TIR domain-containing protein [Caulobacterales bacterium]